MNDTSPEAEEVRLRIFREMSPVQRLAIAMDWSRSVREMTRQGLRRQYPNCSERKLHRLMADRLLGEELALKVYGPLNEHE